jgi:hypothetical protein
MLRQFSNTMGRRDHRIAIFAAGLHAEPIVAVCAGVSHPSDKNAKKKITPVTKI